MYSKVVLGRYLYILRSEIRNLSLAMKRLTVVPRYAEKGSLPLYDDSREAWFGVPMYQWRSPGSIAKEVIDIRTDGRKIGIRFESDFWEGQRAVVRKFTAKVSQGLTGFIFEAPPGFGKTVCMIAMMEVIDCTTLIVVPRSNLIKQWKERLTEHSNLRMSEIGHARGGRCVWKGKKVVVGLVHSLVLDRYGADFSKNFGAVFFDEVDRSVPPETFAPCVPMFPARYRIGASATLKRPDGMEVVFEKHIGQSFLRGSDANRMKPKVLVHEYHGDSGYVHAESATLNRRGMLLSRLASNADRNMLLCRYVKLLYASDRRLLVLSDRTKQLMHLRDLCSRMFGVPKEDTGFYVDSLPIGNGKRKRLTEAHISRVASDCKVIFATYGKIALGTDIPDLAGLLYATPQSETGQSKGRIERLLEGKKEPVVVDIIDLAYNDAVGWARKREMLYLSEGLVVKRIR